MYDAFLFLCSGVLKRFRFFQSIVTVAIVTGLLFLVLFVIAIWWCVKQCVTKKLDLRDRPTPCPLCRSKENLRVRLCCRICFSILGVFMLFGIIIAAVGGILLNNGVKNVFGKSVTIFSWIIDLINKLVNLDGANRTGSTQRVFYCSICYAFLLLFYLFFFFVNVFHFHFHQSGKL